MTPTMDVDLYGDGVAVRLEFATLTPGWGALLLVHPHAVARWWHRIPEQRPLYLAREFAMIARGECPDCTPAPVDVWGPLTGMDWQAVADRVAEAMPLPTLSGEDA